jgi:hypothetical protein
MHLASSNFGEITDLLWLARTEVLRHTSVVSLMRRLYNSALGQYGVNAYFLPPAGSRLRLPIEFHSAEERTQEYDEQTVLKNKPKDVLRRAEGAISAGDLRCVP